MLFRSMEIGISDLVIPKRGRDSGKVFYVVGIEEEYLFLADGRVRKIEKPKKKKLKHIDFAAKCEDRTALKLRNGEKVANSEIRRALAEYAARSGGEEGGMY